MLRKIRITLAAIFFIAVTILFLDFTGTVHAWLGWTAQVQLLPALLALNIGVVIALIAVTLLLGRVYCSVVCPLGVMQDIISWLSGRRRGKKARFGFSPAKTALRYIVLAMFIIAIVAGFTAIASIIAPYSAYGRIASNLFAPIYQWCNNLLAHMAERADSYAFYHTEVWLKSALTLGVAIVTFIALAVLAWRGGRTYCNTICPVGTVLGFLSRWSLLRPVIDTSRCTGCSLCERKCKASCLNHKSHSIDYSRCVACMDCLDNCSQKAIKLQYRLKKTTESDNSKTPANEGRRSFLATTAIVGTSLLIDAKHKKHAMKVDGGLAIIQDKKIPHRETPIVPAGAVSAKHFSQHCTTCQLCVSVCPNQVLRPSSDLATLMQPVMSYELGYCRPECTHCADVCPSNAINPITIEEKSSIQIGHAVWVKENCVVITDNVECGNCARHCPAGAILMVPLNADDDSSRKIPVVNTERCIGCGACENLCPARPFSAIYVEGNNVHHTI